MHDEEHDRMMQYATPRGRDVESGRLPHAVRYNGIEYNSVSSAESAGVPAFTAEALADMQATIRPDEWSIRLYGDGDGPESGPVHIDVDYGEWRDKPFSLSIVWIVGGSVAAVFSTVGGGPVGTGPELVRADLDPDTMRTMYRTGENTIIDCMNRIVGAG